MNVLLILMDSLNRRHLSCYGNDWIRTPNMRRLADRGIVFDNHYMGSALCIPARRELFTGRKEFLWRGWGQPEPFDSNLAVIAREQGAYTAISTDHIHYWDRSHGYGYTEQFEDRAFIHGQEGDRPVAPAVRDRDLPQWVKSMARYHPTEICMRYYRNVMSYTDEEDFHCARVMNAGVEAIEGNAKRDKFFILIESFDPHIPWHIPEPYCSMYGPYREDFTCMAPHRWMDCYRSFVEDDPPEQIAFLRNQYAGNVTMVDHQLGKVLDALDRRNLWDSTVVILTTDHGLELGERDNWYATYPHYNLHANLPLVIWHPDHPGPRRSGAYANMVDVHATIADVLGAADYRPPHGRSLMPVISGQQQQVRDGVLYGMYGMGACWVDDDYTFMSGYDNDIQMPHWYSTMMYRGSPAPDAVAGKFMPDVDVPVWRFPCVYMWPFAAKLPPEVYARSDYDQMADLSADANVLGQCRLRLRAAFDDETAPPEQYRRLLLD